MRVEYSAIEEGSTCIFRAPRIAASLHSMYPNDYMLNVEAGLCTELRSRVPCSTFALIKPGFHTMCSLLVKVYALLLAQHAPGGVCHTSTISYFHMNLMCFKSFESIRTTSRPELLGSFRLIRCVSKVSNLFEPLVQQHYKVVSHEFDVLKVSNLLEPLIDQHYKVVSPQFDVF